MAAVMQVLESHSWCLQRVGRFQTASKQMVNTVLGCGVWFLLSLLRLAAD